MKSIKLRLWCAIAGVTIVVLLCTWLFQVLFLEHFYLKQKKEEMLEHTQEICEMIEENDGYFSVASQLNELADNYNYSINLYNEYFMLTQPFHPTGSLNLLQSTKELQLESFNLMRDLALSGSTMRLYELTNSLNNGHYYVGAAIVSTTSGNTYFVLVASTLAPVSEAVATIRNQLIILTVALLLFASILAVILSRSLTKPISQLTDATQKIAGGDFEVQVAVASKDELGTLGQNFNTMAKEIARSSQLQRELIANVSHDIRTPLTMIKGYAETIKDLTGDHKEKREEQLDIIIEESDRLNELVNDILDLSKLQAGQVVLTPTTFDLSQLLQEIVKRFDLLSVNEQFTFTLDAPQHVLVFADESKITQVIYNLIHNAVNHTGADKQVHIKVTELKDHVTVSISDSGKGIQPEHIPFIWERYYKPYKKDDRTGMGTGLGLSIVKNILTAHHFAFGVQSELEQGSTFWFEIKKESPSIPE